MNTRFTTGATLTLAILALSTGASAQPAQNAEAINQQGKQLFKEKRYLEAYKRFKQAASMQAEGRYLFNVCFSLNFLERYQEAIDACEQVEGAGADAKLLKKTRTVLDALYAKLPPSPDPANPDPANPNPDPANPNPDPANPNPDPANPNPDPANPNPYPTNPNPNPAPADPNAPDPFAIQAKESPGEYQWSVGASFAPVRNLGLGNGEMVENVYEDGGIRLNAFANFIYDQTRRLGVQGYVALTSLPPMNRNGDTLSIVDVGAAAYKHFNLRPNIQWTPLVGAHLGLFQPNSDLDEAMTSIGLRAQVSLDWSFGANKAHVISFAPSVNLYTAASDSSNLSSESYGLDRPGVTIEFGFGYQFRSTKPFGEGPLFTLE